MSCHVVPSVTHQYYELFTKCVTPNVTHVHFTMYKSWRLAIFFEHFTHFTRYTSPDPRRHASPRTLSRALPSLARQIACHGVDCLSCQCEACLRNRILALECPSCQRPVGLVCQLFAVAIYTWEWISVRYPINLYSSRKMSRAPSTVLPVYPSDNCFSPERRWILRSVRTNWGDEGERVGDGDRVIDGLRPGPLDAVEAADNVDDDEEEEAKSTADVGRRLWSIAWPMCGQGVTERRPTGCNIYAAEKHWTVWWNQPAAVRRLLVLRPATDQKLAESISSERPTMTFAWTAW